MTANLDVSVIIVNWNGADHLRICLPSLGSHSKYSIGRVQTKNSRIGRRKRTKQKLIRADSHSLETKQRVMRILDGKQLDYLFVDADHTYSGVQQDFKMASPSARQSAAVQSARDGWKCQYRGSTMNLHVHHLRKRSHLGPDAADNLITLCASCHSQEHTTEAHTSR